MNVPEVTIFDAILVTKNHSFLTIEEVLNHLSINKNGELSIYADDPRKNCFISGPEEKLEYILGMIILGARNKNEVWNIFESNIYPALKRMYPRFDHIRYWGSYDICPGGIWSCHDFIKNFFNKYGITLEQFIRDKAYSILVDVDSQAISRMIENNMINLENFESIYNKEAIEEIDNASKYKNW